MVWESREIEPAFKSRSRFRQRHRVLVQQHARNEATRLKHAAGTSDGVTPHEERPGRFGETQADLDGKLGAVLPAAGQIASLSHRPHTRIQGVARTVLSMEVPHTLGHEDLEGLAEELLARVAEHRFDPGVDEDHASALVDDDDPL